MVRFDFQDLEFVQEKGYVKVIFLKHFYFDIKNEDLAKIGDFSIGKHYIEFDASEKRSLKFYELIDRGIANLKSIITGKHTVFVFRDSGIPLIGNNSFGIVDRGSNLIEIKPICGCNLDCMYCSVDEKKRSVDFLVDKDYLIDELIKVVEIKNSDSVEIHIGCNGEPLLYSKLVSLVEDISKIPKVKKISMDTNGTLLSEKIIDELISAGMTRFNLSLNTLDIDVAKKIAGCNFSVNHSKKIAEYIIKKGVSLTIAPVWMQGVNDDDMEKIIVYGKKIGADLGIQNFLSYQFGKNPVKEYPMEEFYAKLGSLEKKYNTHLILSASDFGIVADNSVKKIFDKDQIIDAIIVSNGRLPSEMIAVSKNRCISVYDTNKKIGQRVKIKITKNKHSIYSGVIV